VIAWSATFSKANVPVTKRELVERERDRAERPQRGLRVGEVDRRRDRSGRHAQLAARQAAEVDSLAQTRGVELDRERAREGEAADAEQVRGAARAQGGVRARRAGRDDLGHQRETHVDAAQPNADVAGGDGRAGGEVDVPAEPREDTCVAEPDLEHRDADGRGGAGRRDEELGALLEGEAAGRVDEAGHLDARGAGNAEAAARVP